MENQQDILPKFQTLLNNTIINEQSITDFTVERSYLNFDPMIYQLNKDSICNFFIVNQNANIKLSNSITILNQGICTDTNLIYNKVIHKSLTEIINYMINYLNSKNNDFYLLYPKNMKNLEDFVLDNELELVQILSQYVVRQAISVILDKLSVDFDTQIKYYFELSVSLYVIFLVFLCFALVVAIFLAYIIFKEIKKFNMLLISIMPNEYISRLLIENR